MAPRMNIYLPADLAEQVRDGDLNVSAITQEALRAELHRRELVGDASDVVARLRQTLEDEPEARKQIRSEADKFYDYGREWAQSWATVGDLEELEEFPDEWRAWQLPADHSIREFMAEAEGWPPNAKGWAWTRNFDAVLEPSSAASELIKGALAVWEQVRDQVYGGDER